MNRAEASIGQQLKWRQKKLIEAAFPHIAECHEKAIARLVVQRICLHTFEKIVSLAYRKTVYKCRRCQFKYVDR